MKRRLALALLLLAAPLGFVLWPLPAGLLQSGPPGSQLVFDRDGALLRELRGTRSGWFQALPRDQAIPAALRAAYIAAEDQRFAWHPGVDPLAVARAAWQNLRAGRIVSGASTIPQQLARQLVPRPRTLPGKAREALWALRLSAQLDRETLLRAYLNRVPLGHDLRGVETAARFYFGRGAAQLSLGQAALLAGMTRSPSALDPTRHPERARRRMRQVLARMEELGLAEPEAVRVASAAPWDLVARPRPMYAPHFVTRIGARHDAARIHSTLDLGLQAEVESATREILEGLRDRNVGQAAVIVLDNASGDVLAWVGSRDFGDATAGGENDGVTSLRQPGSALKPFAYGLALSRGFTPATVLSDVETHLSTPSGDYVPRNYDRRVHGPVRLRAALANSYNVPAVRLAEQLGPHEVLRVLRRAGFQSLDQDASHYGVGVVLGNGDVTLRELARAYRGLARGGVIGPLREVQAAFDARGEAIAVPAELEEQRFMDPTVVALLTHILSDEAARRPAFGDDNALRLPFPVAAKTGTSRAFVDNWCAGFTKERTVAVWVGNFDGRPMRGVSGITGAGPLFHRVMRRAMRGIRAAPLVDTSQFEAAEICPLSGGLRSEACPGVVHEYFLPGTKPSQPCAMHRHLAGRRVLDVGPGFYAWAKKEGLEAGPWPDPAPGGKAELLMPRDGDEFLLELGLPAGDQFVPVRAIAPSGVSRLELRNDDGSVLALLPPFTARLPARRGKRSLELWDPVAGARIATARYRVR